MKPKPKPQQQQSEADRRAAAARYVLSRKDIKQLKMLQVLDNEADDFLDKWGY